LNDLYRILAELLEEGEACATATIVESRGSIPNEVGATMLVDNQGERLAGTVGGGAIEFQTLAECRAAIQEGKSRSFTHHLTEKDAGGIGMMCGGKAQIFVQVHRSRIQLVLVGAGHINLQLARLLADGFDYSTVVVDDRPEWANSAHYPHSLVLNEKVADAFEQINWTDETYVVIATRGEDLKALSAALRRPCRYVGVVASQRKALQLCKSLEREGVDVEANRHKIHAPVGLGLGGRSPAAIALSILAEIEMVRHQGNADSMSVADGDRRPTPLKVLKS
jgi:xanthine dehydrogenase accessory factor